MKPFIYIGSLIKTGSTLLQEMLTQLPHSYIFHEPWFSSGVFQNIELSLKQLPQKARELARTTKSSLEFLTELQKIVPQIGIKEIRNTNWQFYPKYFDVRFVLTGRHPLDIYISCYHQLRRSDAWTPRKPPFSPKGLYIELIPDIRAQIEMHNKGAMLVRYEDLALNNGVFDEIKKFVGSDVDGNGSVGICHRNIKRGEYEVGRHGFSITAKSVARYKTEPNKELLEQANIFYDKMKLYNDLWGY